MSRIIKAKYPKIGNENYSYGVQGIGSIYGGNNESTILEIDTEHEIN